MITNKEMLSVLIIAYNRENYIKYAIESVLASSYKNFELLIVDDCSTDATLDVIKQFSNIDYRIKIFENKKNLGQFENRNYAASLAKGKYIKFVDSDDIIYPHCLEVMVSSMERYPNAGIGFANYWNTYNVPLPIMVESHEAYMQHYFNNGFLFIGPTGSIYNREYFNKIGGFNPYFGVAADFEFNLKAGQFAPVVCFQRDLFWWRSHEGQEFNKRKDEYEKLNNEINEYYLTHPACPLNVNERKIALNNLKNILARGIWIQIFRFKFLSVFKKLKTLNISFAHFFLSIFPSSIRRKLQTKN